MLYSDNASNMIALRVLDRLKAYYASQDVEEVVMNRPEQIWVKPKRRDWTALAAPELTYDYIAHRVCPVLANINGAQFSEGDIPIVACELPGLPYRFQCVVGNNVRYDEGDRRGVALAIRSLLKGTDITFENYGLIKGAKSKNTNEVFDGFSLESDDMQLILSAIEAGMSILVSGPTSSGKTTFVNQVIAQIDPKLRIISVEDARELRISQPNRVHFVVPRHRGSNHIGYNEIIDALMRLTPDYVICGEVSVSNAAALYSLMGKGHPIMSTVHAASPDEAMQAFANNMMTSGIAQDSRVIIDNLEQQVGCIVQLTKRRQVARIAFPALDRHRKAALPRPPLALPPQ